ncbi:DMT family transporter [Jannaschia sp. M317]|uniref:DMT family transporter n=1 Tax=Jannaschia sp. M317 TaxID=2867011 RepID=UPI0021A8B358|nr:DMT family transporter [Jannaschia sp. M317]UWQ18488.1 DMT family transporter [Jannaschia sp. M317]
MPSLAPSLIVPMLVVLAAGIVFAIQSPLNATLARDVGSGVVAATVSVGVSFVVLLALALIQGQGAALARVPAAPPVLWLGGVLGALVVWGMLTSVPVLGIVTALGILLLGQMSTALVLDAIGAFALPVIPITLPRVLGVLMIAAGLLLTRL